MLFRSQSEKTVLGTEIPKVRTVLGQKLKMPQTVPFVYSDGSREKRPVTWSKADVSQAGIVTIKGVSDGREVEARVEVLTIANELPAVKRMAPGTDLSSVDKLVSLVSSDGRIHNYEVENWEISPEDQEKLSTPGAHIQMTSQLGDRTIHATLIVDDGKELAQVTPTIAVGGESVTELSNEHPVHYHKLSYGAKIPEVSASAENADVKVVQANESNGMRASIYVQPKDGG